VAISSTDGVMEFFDLPYLFILTIPLVINHTLAEMIAKGYFWEQSTTGV
jgi:hypothetical protein